MGMRTRGNENEGETYWVRTRSELAGVVSEQVLTLNSDLVLSVPHLLPVAVLANA